ncbi:hypothetical protein Tco_1078289 [Tanacetum coccineum]
MMSSTKFDIVKFDETRDFALWKINMKYLLSQYKCESSLLATKPTRVADTTWHEMLRSAHSVLILCLGDQVLREVNKETTAAGIWIKLETLYMTKSLANCLYLKKKLYAFYMHPGKKQSEHIDEFRKLVGDLAAIDTAISDEDQALSLITSLLSSYENFMKTLLYCEETLNLEDVMATLDSRELQKITEANGDGGEGLYTQKKSQDFVKNKDHVSSSGAHGYDSADRRDYLFDFEEYDGGNVLLSDGKECRVRGTSKGSSINEGWIKFRVGQR